MPTYKQRLAYLHRRLHSIDCVDCREAATLVASAIANGPDAPTLDQEVDLFHAVWGMVSRAGDIADLPLESAFVLDSLESEMAGHVLTARLANGELVKATA